MKRLLCLVCLVTVCGAVAVKASPTNLVVNGDFSAGASGFSTDYDLVPHASESMWPDGTYIVDSSALDVHSLWETGGDHTTGDGQFMLVNGATDGRQTVWKQTISTMPGWEYLFSLWGKNLCCAMGGDFVGPQLAFYINGVEFGSGFTDGPGVWEELTGGFVATARWAELEIRDHSTVYSGNDFGVDDISVEPVPEPTSLLMLATGCILFVRRMRRA